MDNRRFLSYAVAEIRLPPSTALCAAPAARGTEILPAETGQSGIASLSGWSIH